MNNHLSKRTRLFVILLAAAFMFAIIAPSGRADADGTAGKGSIALQAEVGYQGMHNSASWFPVKLTLSHAEDRDLKGEVVITLVTERNISADYIVPVEIPRGSMIEAEAAVFGGRLNRDTSRIRFYEGSFADGKQLDIVGDSYLIGRDMTVYKIGVISRDPDTLNFMPSLNQKGYSISVIPILPEDLPLEATMLDGIDTLVINDSATGEWDARKVDAIKEWVYKGGTLVLAGGAGYAKTAEAFADIAPFAAQGTMEFQHSDSLAAAGGAEWKGETPLTISTGNLIKGKTSISEQGVPLAAAGDAGFGSVIYAAFDPSLEPMSNWAGSAQLWARLLQKTLIPLNSSLQIQIGPSLPFWDIERLLDQFPSIKPPNFMMLLVMFGIYILVVAPVLYLILSKLDRREWSWWIIPTLSVVMGASIFLIGVGDKRVLNAHTLEIVEMAQDGTTILSGGAGVFSPTGGTVTLKYDDAVPLKALTSNSGLGGLSLNGNQQFRLGDEESEAIWRLVPYWSTRKLWMERNLVNAAKVGSLEIAYEQDGSDYNIVVTNRTVSDLTDVSLLANGLIRTIGDLKQGEAGSVKVPASLRGPSGGYYSYSGNMFPYNYNGRQRDEFARERGMIDSYFGNPNSLVASAVPVVVAFSKDHESGFTVNGSKVKSDRLRMWVKEIGAAPQEGGRVAVAADELRPIIVSNTAQQLDYFGDKYVRLREGAIVLEYMVPNSFNVLYDDIRIEIDSNVKMQPAIYEIWHEASGEWRQIVGELAPPSEYLVDVGTLRIKIEVQTEADVIFPYIELEGEELQL